MPLKISHSQNALSQKIGKINLGHIENSLGIAKTLKKREISYFNLIMIFSVFEKRNIDGYLI